MCGADTRVEVLGQSGEETEYRPDLDARPAFLPMGIQTVPETMGEGGRAVLAADVEILGSFEAADLWFEWRIYPGFALSSYEEGWQRLSVGKVTKPGRYSKGLSGLSDGVTYQFRAAVGNEWNVMKGELQLMTV